MSNQWKPEDLYKYPELQQQFQERHDRLISQVESMTDQEVSDRYTQEMLKLKRWNAFGRQSKQFQGYPNTVMMNLCQRELNRRGVPVPQVSLPSEESENSISGDVSSD